MTTLSLILIEDVFMTWVFNYAPLTGIAIFLAWAVWRLGNMSGKYEPRFSKIETDIVDLKGEMKEVKTDIARLDARLGRVEGQMELVISMLGALTKEVHQLTREVSQLPRQRNP